MSSTTKNLDKSADLALIGEFMGVIFYDTQNQYYDSINGLFVGSILHYDTDYNLLIEVVEKIKKLGYKVKMELLSTNGYVYKIKDYNSIDNHIELASVGSIPNKYVSDPPTAEYPMFVAEFKCPKEALYNLLLRFIKWYNLNVDKSQF